jgi:hypothetical protein
MNYDKALKRAWHITWKHKYLWFFGFFAGSGTGFNVPSGGGDGSGSSSSELWSPPGVIGPDEITLIIALVIVGVALGVLFLFLNTVSRGALIQCAYELDVGKPSSFRQGWHNGMKHLWRVLGITLLLGLIGLGYIVVVGTPLVLLGVFGGTGGLIAAIILGVLAVLALIPIAIGVTILNELAARETVLQGTGVRQSIRGAWQLIRTHVGTTLLVWLIQLGIMLGATMVILVGAALLAVPFVLLGIFVNMWLGIIPGVLVGIVYFVLMMAILGTFTSAFWTMAYSDLQPKPIYPEASTPPYSYT